MAPFGVVVGAIAGATAAAVNGGDFKAVGRSAFVGALVGGVTGLTAGTVAAGSSLSISGIVAASATGATASASGDAIGQGIAKASVSKIDGTKVAVAGIAGLASGQLGAFAKAITSSAKAAIKLGALVDGVRSPAVVNAEETDDEDW